MAAPEGCKPLSALLSGIAQAAYYGNGDITEELLRGQLYPEAAPEEFRALSAKMGGLLQHQGWSRDLYRAAVILTVKSLTCYTFPPRKGSAVNNHHGSYWFGGMCFIFH